MTKEEKIILNTKIAKLFGWHDFWIDSVSQFGRSRHMGLHGMTNYPMEVPDYCGSWSGAGNLIERLELMEANVEICISKSVPGISVDIVIPFQRYTGYGLAVPEAVANAVSKMIDDVSVKEYLESWK